MIRTALILAAVATLSSAPLAARPVNGYTATPVSAPAKDSFITRTVVWHCSDGTCTAPMAGSRPQIMCELVAKEVGKLSDFSVDGQALSAEKLAKCNKKAK